MNKITYSVVIPCYNSVNSIETLVKSIYEESKKLDNYELKNIICVNDFSKDQTNKVLSELSKEYSNLIPISNNSNIGQVKSTLKGFEIVNSDLVITLDDDGQHPASEIKKLLLYYEKNKLDFVIGFWKNDETFIRNLSSVGANFLMSILIFKSPKFRLTAFRVINSKLIPKILEKFKKSTIMDLRKISKSYDMLEVEHNSNPLNRKFSNFLSRLKITIIYIFLETYFLAILFICILIYIFL